MTDLKIRDNIARQYRASMAMLGQAINACPESLWVASEYVNRFWHIAYHALFYTHLYLQPTEADFRCWTKHRKDLQSLGRRKSDTQNVAKVETAYSKVDVLGYYEICCAEVDLTVPALDREAPSGFSWLPFNKLELQFYNIRHLQHHTGQLADRLRTAVNIGVDWVRPD